MIDIKQYIKENTNTIKVGNVTVSNDIFNECFECDLDKCKGACCAKGICGAELTNDEIDILDDVFNEVKAYMDEEGIQIIEQNGTSKKYDKFTGTQLKKNSSCSFSINENGITLCAIDKAYRDGNKFLNDINFSKPISCHLYPIVKNGNKLNYDTDERCVCKECKEPVCITQKDSLVRLFGESWYNKLIRHRND